MSLNGEEFRADEGLAEEGVRIVVDARRVSGALISQLTSRWMHVQAVASCAAGLT